MENKWYDSTFSYLLGGGLCFGLGLLGLGGGIGLSRSNYYNSEIEKLKKGYRIQEANLLGSEIPEKFYIIDGDVALIEVDGKPIVKGLENSLKILK